MNKDKIYEVLERYSKDCERMIEEKDPFVLELDHIRQMIPQVQEFIRQGRMEKAFRWLGFIQGTFWVIGVYSIQEMKDHNRP